MWGVRRGDGSLDWYRLCLGVLTEESIVCWNGVRLGIGRIGWLGWFVKGEEERKKWLAEWLAG